MVYRGFHLIELELKLLMPQSLLEADDFANLLILTSLCKSVNKPI